MGRRGDVKEVLKTSYNNKNLSIVFETLIQKDIFCTHTQTITNFICIQNPFHIKSQTRKRNFNVISNLMTNCRPTVAERSRVSRKVVGSNPGDGEFEILPFFCGRKQSNDIND